jgi:hypothetical protein
MDRLTRTVRQQVALGRLLPLGGPDDPAWITERAAVTLLRSAAAGVPGVRLGATTLGPARRAGHDAGGPGADVVPGAAPVGALPHVPLAIEAEFEATVTQPLPQSAERLREALWAAARDAVGLTVAAVDLAVTGLLEDERDGTDADGADAGRAADAMDPEETSPVGPGIAQSPAEAVEAAVRVVPGVLRLTGRLAILGSGVRVTDEPAVRYARPAADGGGDPADDAAGAAGSPDGRADGGPAVRGRRVQVQIAVAAGHVPLVVARTVAGAAAKAAAADAPGPVSTAVVVTDAGC